MTFKRLSSIILKKVLKDTKRLHTSRKNRVILILIKSICKAPAPCAVGFLFCRRPSSRPNQPSDSGGRMKYWETVFIIFMILLFITLWLWMWLRAYYNNKKDEE